LMPILFYFTIAFTLQLHLILTYQAPVLFINIIWGFLFFLMFFYRNKFYYPKDHPYYLDRYKQFVIALGLIIFLILTNLYLQAFIAIKTDSQLVKIVETLKQDGPVQLEGKITTNIKIDGNRIRFELRVKRINDERLPRAEKVIITRYASQQHELYDYQQVKRGDSWQGEVSLSMPFSARNLGGFNYQRFLAQQYIYVTGVIETDSFVSISQPAIIDRFARLLDERRVRWLSQIDVLFDPKLAPVIQAMTMGYREQIDEDLLQMYQQLGLIHLLAISGLHVGIIIWGLYHLLLKLKISRERAITLLILLIPIYIYLSGAQVSVIRAGLMAIAVLICLRLGYWRQSIIALFTVYILLLLWYPYYLYQVGFQLSFLITFLLVTAYKPMIHLLCKWPARFAQAVSVALIAQLGSIPVILLHFYQLSPYSLILNILLVPVYTFVLIPGAFVLTIISFLSIQVVTLAVDGYQLIFSFVHELIARVRAFPYANLHFGKPAVWWIILYMIVTGALFYFAEQKKRLISLSILLFIPGLLSVQLLLPYMDRKAHVMMLDVGQGESIVIELPYRKEVMMIDLGGQVRFQAMEWMRPSQPFEVGKDILLPYLRYRGINKIDRIIISHGHYDHFGGIEGLLGEIKIERLYRSPIPSQGVFEREWLGRVHEEGIQIYGLFKGHSWQTKQAFFQVVFPDPPTATQAHPFKLHDYNLVLWSHIYGVSFLWTGDLEAEREKEIISWYPGIKADILKVGHHGSLTSTSAELLNQLKPSIALISVGRRNLYRHPHPEVIARLTEREVDIFRTDEMGGIYIQLSPNRLRVIPSLQ